ncbi:uncharacterized protein KY384_001417 [Bacidia gigantensis]|uniref:uncharacterized protein n=1 Tax=Bacidia gigantensis TaxID=2732470 RepID=UPI001D052E04|nr:uncharacterized protein KY384_001417 [Bacidia gigantensis]KAG8533676.1 hypothetical protein KY384_001417 [Bacidia gigantensis]
MGLRMDDLHAPTVASGPTSTPSSTFDPSTDKRSLLELIDLKTNMEEELSALGSVLDSVTPPFLLFPPAPIFSLPISAQTSTTFPPPSTTPTNRPPKHGVNLTTSLLDANDFPRSDIDVAQIRTTRTRIIRLRNDYKAVMSRIEKGLHERHAEYASSPNPTTPSTTTASSHQQRQVRQAPVQQREDGLVETPFAKVNLVASGGPAEQAGLKVGDRVRRIGDVSWLNHEKLAKVAEVVQRNQGREVDVRVVREGSGEEVELKLIPRSGWGGRGLLGCHLLPL